MRSAKQGNYHKGLINFHRSFSLKDPAVWFHAFRKQKHWELGNAYPLSGVRASIWPGILQLSQEVFSIFVRKPSV